MAKILLVEDDKSLREIYGVRLMAEGYEIVSAGDGEEALALAIKERPDLIVSDVMMPKISGFDMLDILRSTSETKDVKVIMMTALSSDDQRARGESLGADRYLVKSQVGIEDVVRTVHDVLGDGVGGAAPAAAPIADPAAMPAAAMPQSVAPASPLPSFDPIAQAPVPSFADPSFTPVPAPVPEPVVMPAPAPITDPATLSFDTVTPAPAPAAPVAPTPMPTELPQPTAPFSSPAPASLGDQFAPTPAATPAPVAPPVAPAPAPAPVVPVQPPMPVPEPVAMPAPAPTAPIDAPFTPPAPLAPSPSQPLDLAAQMQQALNDATQTPPAAPLQ